MDRELLKQYLKECLENLEAGTITVDSNDTIIRLEQLINYSISMKSLKAYSLPDRLVTVILTLYCLGIIDMNKANDYIERLLENMEDKTDTSIDIE